MRVVYFIYVVPHEGTWIEMVFATAKGFLWKTSFPTRERGLKYCITVKKGKEHASFPTRERGLKYISSHRNICLKWSFPTRERGLKCANSLLIAEHGWSFPTRERGLKFTVCFEYRRRIWSFPTRERGLKFSFSGISILIPFVVPHEGTWIEILNRRTGERGNECRSPRGNVD